MAEDPVIHLEGIGDREYTFHDKIDPTRIKSELDHNGFKVIPLNTVICFAHVKF